MIAQIRIREGDGVIGSDGAYVRGISLSSCMGILGSACGCVPVVHLRFGVGAETRENVVRRDPPAPPRDPRPWWRRFGSRLP